MFDTAPPPTIRDLYRMTDGRGDFLRMLPALTASQIVGTVKASFQQSPRNRLCTRAELEALGRTDLPDLWEVRLPQVTATEHHALSRIVRRSAST